MGKILQTFDHGERAVARLSFAKWLIGIPAVIVASLLAALNTPIVKLFAPLSYVFVALVSTLLFVLTVAAGSWAYRRFVNPLPLPNLLTSDDVRQIVKDCFADERAEELKRIAALPHDFEATNEKRRILAATNYIIGLAEARMGRRLSAFLGQSKAVLDAHRHDVSSINVQMTMKGFDRPLGNLAHELRVLGVNLEDIQEKAKALQLEVASNPQMLIVGNGEHWPSPEAKRDWHMRLAIWDAYKQAVDSLSLRQNTTLLDVVVNAKPLGGSNEQQR